MDKTITDKKQLQQFIDNIPFDTLLDLIWNSEDYGVEDPLFDVCLWNGSYDDHITYRGDYYNPPETADDLDVEETIETLKLIDALYEKDNGERVIYNYFFGDNRKKPLFDGSKLAKMTYNPDKNTYTLYFEENYDAEINPSDYMDSFSDYYDFTDFVVGFKGFSLELPADLVEQYL